MAAIVDIVSRRGLRIGARHRNHRYRASVTGLETPVIDVLSVLRYNYNNVAGINYSWLR